MAEETILDVQDLKVRFNTAEGTIHAVNGVSFQIKKGEVVAIVGESGSGKSVTMMSVLGLIPKPPGEIYSGTAVYEDRDLLQLNERQLEEIRGRDIGMIFQDPMTSLNPVLSLERQMTEAIVRHYDVDKGQARAKAIELMELVGISDAANRINSYPHQFSGGMRQRVMIAMMLACNPVLLIADEPTTALDVTIQAQIVDLAIRMRETIGMGMIWITHDLGVVAGMADRVIVMYGGTIVEEGDVFNVYEDPQHPYTLALLDALPRMDRRRENAKLMAIPGSPPNLLTPLQGCPFAPRCPYVLEQCWQEIPQLTERGEMHRAACFNVELTLTAEPQTADTQTTN